MIQKGAKTTQTTQRPEGMANACSGHSFGNFVIDVSSRAGVAEGAALRLHEDMWMCPGVGFPPVSGFESK